VKRALTRIEVIDMDYQNDNDFYNKVEKEHNKFINYIKRKGKEALDFGGNLLKISAPWAHITRKLNNPEFFKGLYDIGMGEVKPIKDLGEKVIKANEKYLPKNKSDLTLSDLVRV
jgi:hypothetical protein